MLAQLSPQTIILPDQSDEKLIEFLTAEHGAAATLIKMSSKEFGFGKGRIALLNWYISRIRQQQQQQQPANIATQTGTEDTGMANHHIYFRDYQEGIKTHACLQMEGLIELDGSQLTVSVHRVRIAELRECQHGLDWLCWRAVEAFTQDAARAQCARRGSWSRASDSPTRCNQGIFVVSAAWRQMACACLLCKCAAIDTCKSIQIPCGK